MGWGRTLFLGDVGNRLDIQDTERDVIQLRRKVERKERADQAQDERLAALEQENDQLKLYLASLLRLLVSKGALGSEELEAFVEIIDPEESA